MSKENKKLKIRDIREGNWYWVHNIIYRKYSKKIGVTGLALYNAYAFYASQKGKCFPTQSEIADKLGVSERTIQRANKKLQQNRLIHIESGKQEGKANIVYLLKVEKQKGCDTQSEGYENMSQRVRHCVAQNNNSSNNKLKISPYKEGGDKTSLVRTSLVRRDENSDIEYLIDFLKKQNSLRKLDGSKKENRRYCLLCLKKFNSKENVENLIKAAASSDFHSQNLTSFKYLYNHGVKIAAEYRGKRNRVAIIK